MWDLDLSCVTFDLKGGAALLLETIHVGGVHNMVKIRATIHDDALGAESSSLSIPKEAIPALIAELKSLMGDER
jgi:hypothetical protein